MEIKTQLLNQLERWANNLQTVKNDHNVQKLQEIMFLEKINLSIQNVSDDTLIRKYEHMKLLYDQIVSCKQLFHHRYHEDTFQTLYNKYLTSKRGNQQKKQSVRLEEKQDDQEDYSQDIDFYQYQINKLKQQIEQHDHLQLEKELRQLEQENNDIKQEFEQIKEDNLYLREQILTNKLRVEEIKQQQEKMIYELNQYFI